MNNYSCAALGLISFIFIIKSSGLSAETSAHAVRLSSCGCCGGSAGATRPLVLGKHMESPPRVRHPFTFAQVERLSAYHAP
ncbi:hypothetical protein V1517DRAFT_332635 [Lipomyces orientalis]|uniref:Uncharacterized protein n=1 Tax=Lipomyces orientalis TaxID=1233043 RepID=A0ACC3TE30_9ASCO